MLRKLGFIILAHEEINMFLIGIKFNPRATTHPINLSTLYHAEFQKYYVQVHWWPDKSEWDLNENITTPEEIDSLLKF